MQLLPPSSMLTFGALVVTLLSVFLTLSKRDPDYEIKTFIDRFVFILREWRTLIVYCVMANHVAVFLILVFFIFEGSAVAILLKVSSFILLLGGSSAFFFLLLVALILGYQEQQTKMEVQP